MTENNNEIAFSSWQPFGVHSKYGTVNMGRWEGKYGKVNMGSLKSRSRVSCVLLGHVSTVGHFKLNCKLLKFSLSDINSKLTDDE